MIFMIIESKFHHISVAASNLILKHHRSIRDAVLCRVYRFQFTINQSFTRTNVKRKLLERSNSFAIINNTKIIWYCWGKIISKHIHIHTHTHTCMLRENFVNKLFLIRVLLRRKFYFLLSSFIHLPGWTILFINIIS